MTVLMIDTSAYIAFKYGHKAAVSGIRRAQTIYVPAIVLGELLAGFEGGQRRERNRRELAAFLQSPRVATPPVGPETAERYAAIYAYLRCHGRPIPTNDLWIAATAMEHGARLMTGDRHLQHVPQILVEYLTTAPEAPE